MNAPTTRRDFLKALGKTSAATLAIAPLMALVPSESSTDSDYITVHKSLLEIAPEAPAPYGPPERTALIDACIAKVDETLITLERFYSFLHEARALPPSEVDGAKWIKLEYAVIDAETELDNAMQSSTFFEDALEAATGKRSYYWCIKSDLIGNDKIDAAFIQSEINAFREDYPGQVAELQALLNARLGA